MLKKAGWRRLSVPVVAALLTGCSGADARLAIAEAFVDAFYDWDRERLASLMVPGADADRVLYYQGWAQAAHYQVHERRPCRPAESHVVCAITVTDDFGSVLGYMATDTFTLSVDGSLVRAVTFEGDDPPIFDELFEWLAQTRPETFSGPCLNMFEGGITPGACAQAVAQGARDFMER